MTREIFTPSPLYTIATIGPYPITHPYQVGSEIDVKIFQGSTIVELVNGTDFTVAPSSSETTGDVTLSASIFTAYTGASLLIRRVSVADQGWAGQTAREKGLEAQLDTLTQRLQEIDEAVARAIKLPENAAPELPLDTSGQWLGFDASNQIFAGAGAVAGIPATAFMATLLDDADAATARATLGAGDMNNLSDDLTPQLGGALDTNSKPIDWSQGADVASAAELLVLRDGNSFNVTGALAITSIETTADAWPIGSVIMLKFTGAATLTHDAANLVLLGGANITVAAGDWAVFRKYAAGDWEMASFSGVSTTAEWEAGTSTKPSLASPADVKAAAGLTAFVLKQNLAINSGTLFTNSSGGHDPLFYKCYLTCLTAEVGFTAGEVLPVYPNQNTGSGGNGFTIYIDTSGRLNGMFGVAAAVFETLDQSTGATVSLTNANWDLTIIAYE